MWGKERIYYFKTGASSGTSIGENTKESFYGHRKRDFLSKITIALKEAAETEYWLELLIETKYLEKELGYSLLNDCKEIIRILSATAKTTKKHLQTENKE